MTVRNMVRSHLTNVCFWLGYCVLLSNDHININQILFTPCHDWYNFIFTEVFSLSALHLHSPNLRPPSGVLLTPEQVFLSEISSSMESHQMYYPSYQPPWLNTSNTAAAPSCNSLVVSRYTPGHLADSHHLSIRKHLTCLLNSFFHNTLLNYEL